MILPSIQQEFCNLNYSWDVDDIQLLCTAERSGEKILQRACHQGIISSGIRVGTPNECQRSVILHFNHFSSCFYLSLWASWRPCFLHWGRRNSDGLCPCSSLPGFRRAPTLQSNRLRDEFLIAVWTSLSCQPAQGARCVDWAECRRLQRPVHWVPLAGLLWVKEFSSKGLSFQRPKLELQYLCGRVAVRMTEMARES